MKYRIIQYLQPWEIDDFERQMNTMILSSFFINPLDEVIWDVTLNISDDIVNWEQSSITKKYITNKFNYLETIIKQYFTTEFDIDPIIQGCTDKRRSCQDKDHDFVLWLDSDIYFSLSTLPYLIDASKHIQDECFMVSPQIIKYWDDSWDCIVNEKFLSQPHNHRDFFDLYSIEKFVSNNEITLRQNRTMKFGGGWFNLFKKNMFEYIPLPHELGSYASDDTYIMMCSNKYGIKQYLINGLIVSEIGGRYLDGKQYLKDCFNIKLKDRSIISMEKFDELIHNFYQH